jgi:hypothetical protein
MTIQGAMNELINLLNADDIPIYYKGCIEKVIETIDDYIGGGDGYVKRRADRKTENSSEKPNNCEPQKWTKENCKGCKYNEYPYDSGTCFVRVCIHGNKYEPKDEPQTERKGE